MSSGEESTLTIQTIFNRQYCFQRIEGGCFKPPRSSAIQGSGSHLRPRVIPSESLGGLRTRRKSLTELVANKFEPAMHAQVG